MQRKYYFTDMMLLLFLIMQIIFWQYSSKFKPDFSIVPNVPSTTAVKALSLGDEQFYFRILSYQLQNAGDSFGRFTALKEYNYVKLYNWFTLLDVLDPQSNFVASLAAYYYSQTQNTADVIYVINYLDEHSSRDLYNKWWWMSQAVYLANHRLKDQDLALKLAHKLSAVPRDDVPLWAKQMPAFILEQKGEIEAALEVIAYIVNNQENLDQGELNFMRYFVEERLERAIEKYPELGKLLQKKE